MKRKRTGYMKYGGKEWSDITIITIYRAGIGAGPGESLEHSINSAYAADRDQVTEALLAKELQQ